MKIINPYTTAIRNNHEQPLELKKNESIETNTKATNSLTSNSVKKQLKAGLAIPEDVQRIINALKTKLPINNEVVRQLNEFITNSEGTFDQKLETVKMLLNKNLEMTQAHLKAIHQALHGTPDIKKANLEILLQQNIEKEERLSSEIKLPNTVNDQLNHSKENHIININVINGIKNEVKLAVQQGYSIDSVIKHLKNKLDHNPSMDTEFLNEVKTILTETQQISRANEGFNVTQNSQLQEHILTRLDEVSKKIESTKELSSETIKTSFHSNSIVNDQAEFLTSSINLQSKDIIVNTITKRLAEATIQFRDIKREIVRNIDQITTQTAQTNKSIYQNIKSLLESAINKLDHAILKSDIVYLTDMKTEKTLMQASSRLAEARVHLENGNQPKAIEILQEVKQTIDQLKWQPSETKIKHFVAKESLFLHDNDFGNWPNKYSEMVKVHSQLEGSARGMFELIRGQGLNHDSEIAQNLALNKFDSQPEEIQKNMKAVIMKVLETGANEARNPEGRLAAENTLQSITGQQLLSKFDSGSNMQSMFFNLPAYFGEKIENIKVYINSRKDGDKIDWENSSLYFLIETKKLGETGVLVSSSNRNLSITIKNDHPAIENKLENIVTQYKERIQEIGYSVIGIYFKKLNEQNPQRDNHHELQEKQRIQPEPYTHNQEGYDFRI